MNTHVLDAREGLVVLDDHPTLEALDARALPNGAVLSLRGCRSLRRVRLPEAHALDVRIDRAIDAAPLHLDGRIGALRGRVGPWKLVHVELPDSRRVGWHGYVGPAAEAPDEAAVRVAIGPGALAAVARGRRGLIRVALGDPAGRDFHLDARAEAPVSVQIEACTALRVVRVGPVATSLSIARCGAIEEVDGSGTRAALVACGGAPRLHALGEWGHLVVHDCPVPELLTAAPVVYAQGNWGRVRSLRGAVRLFGEPPARYPWRLPSPDARAQRLPPDESWARTLLVDALEDDAVTRERATRWVARAQLHVASSLTELGRRLDSGVPVERLWPVRAAIEASLPGQLRRGEDPGDVPSSLRYWFWPGAEPEVTEAAWLADLALIEAAEASAEPVVKAAATACAQAIGHPGNVWELRLLAAGLVRRFREGRPVEWVEALVRRWFGTPPPARWPGHPTARGLWGFHYTDLPVAEHGDAVAAWLALAPPGPGGERWLDAFLDWLHRTDSGPDGLAVLVRLAERGHAEARRLLADAALRGGMWSPEERAEALRRVLAGVGG